MQTFLPHPNYTLSAEVLDSQRLIKQVPEAIQILNNLQPDTARYLGYSDKAGWRNHPAVKMWVGYPISLAEYLQVMIDECSDRGFKITDKTRDAVGVHIRASKRNNESDKAPFWMGNEALHLSHQSNLLRKDPEHYGKFGWNVEPTLEYVWPVK